MLLIISLMYNKNIKGPSTVPFGTSDSTDIGLEDVPPTTTDWEHSVSHN